MLYPDFDELIAFKERISDRVEFSNRSVASIVPQNHHSPFRGQGLEFDAVREYVPGDDIRNIDWRVTARTGSPHLKLFKEERERQLVICVDMNANMRFGTKKTFKSVQAARTAALLGWRGIAHQDRVSACLFGDVPNGIQFFAPARTKKSWVAMLKMLAQPTVENHDISLNDALQNINQGVHTGSLIYIISDFMDINKNLQLESGLRRLNKKGDVIFIAINDQADKSIFPIGTVGFCGSMVEKIHVNTKSIAGRAAYEAQWLENRQCLYEISFRCKIPMIELTTESEVSRDLILGLKAIAKRKKR
jgi:uncharacterized protein (DUF58 family)